MGLFYAPRTVEAGVAGKSVVTPEPDWRRVGGGLALAAVLLIAAICLENSPNHAESSQTLLRAFEILFTAILALLGIETSKQ